jgi:ADP-ribosylation factor GTPase-activating protein 1
LDYKDKLSAEIEGKTWTPTARPPRPYRSTTPLPQSNSQPISRASSTSSFQSSQPQQPISAAQKARNESYFASLGNANATRPENLPPSQGGRYGGFGSTPSPGPQQQQQQQSLSVEDFTTDPLGSLTKGWSLFSKAAVKTASMVNETYVQPSVAKVSLPSRVSR